MNIIVKKYKEDANVRLFLQILFIMLMSRLFMLVFMAVFNINQGTDHSIAFLMNQWDAKRYQFMTDNGYTFPQDIDPQANWAFFPMYVLVCMAAKALTFGLINTYWIGMIVSNVCIFIAAFYGVKLLRNAGLTAVEKSDFKIKDGLFLAVLLMWAPYSFYFGSMYTEAMFVMFIVLFFYACQKKHFFTAGIMAALASATRIVGCLLVFSLIIEIYLDMKERGVTIKTFVPELLKAPEKIVSILICPLGAFCYMSFLHFFCGDVWAFKNVQIAWREDEYFPVLGVLWKACTGQIELRYTYMGWFCIAVIALYIYMFKKKHYSMAVFGLSTLLVALSSHVMSTCRFTVGSFAAFVGVYDLLSGCNKILRRILCGFFVMAEIWLLIMWYNSDCWLM